LFHKFFLSGPNLWVARSSSFLVQSFLKKFSLRHANLARRVVLIPAMARP
jgi:hypothetical protein